MFLVIFLLITLTASFQGQSSAHRNQGFVNSALEKCIDLCQSYSCQNDRNIRDGCNQMFSCAQGCKLRQLGIEREVCKLEACDRNGQSGCSPNVNGFEFDLCRECDRGGCEAMHVVECEQGCTFYSTGFYESIKISAQGTAVDFLSGNWNYDSLYGGRPAYRFENGGYYLFWQENRWIVETEIGRHMHESGGSPLFGYIRAEVDVPWPQSVGDKWMEVYSGEVDPNISVTGY